MTRLRLAGILAALTLAGCPSVGNPEIVRRYEGFPPESKAAQLFEFARTKTSPEDLPSAISILRELTLSYPENVPVHREYQNRKVEGGQRAELLQEYRERLVLRRSPANLYLYARLLPTPEEAEPLIREAIAIEPDFYWGHFALGVAKRDLGDRERAKRSLALALEIAPEFAEAHWEMGEILQAGDVEGAKDSFQEFLKLRPESVPVHLNLGILYLALNRPEDAQGLFDWVLLKEPRNRDALYARAAAFLRQEEPEEAAKVYRQILANDPEESLAHYNLGILNEQNFSKLEEALREYEAFLAAKESSEMLLRRLQAQIWMEKLREKLGKR